MRLCGKCGKVILRVHRWQMVHHELKVWKWVVFRWSEQVQRDCARPLEIHPRVTPLRYGPGLFKNTNLSITEVEPR